jgi:flagellar basal-body rod protein FlgG
MCPLDVAIQGRGFFRVKSNDAMLYTRNGAFFVNNRNELVLNAGDGYELVPPIYYPVGADIDRIEFSQAGVVSMVPIGGDTHQSIGQIQLYDFPNPTRLKPLGHGLYQQTDQTGPAKPQDMGAPTTATLLQHFLESPPNDAAN